MGKIRKPSKKKLIIGFIYKDEAILSKIEALLIKRFGPIDKRSGKFAFNHTKYYEKEMGQNLSKKFISFKRPVKAEKIWRVKLFTNKLESRFAHCSRRWINIDPGYIDLNKLVLFTTKDYSHRIYLGDGIFGEVTLCFKGGGFLPFEHTYPDYKTKDYIDFFTSVRNTCKSSSPP